ncbi:Uncharacterized protein, contains GBA2_N and DUF608 domains [bacterium A37T11]|nr:Uncharacterized protein, contains GBA2_N and DUF608 domains [bacterium A37T11]
MNSEKINTQSSRRMFLKESGLLSLALISTRFPAWGKSVFSAGYARHNIPADKQIDPAWLASIYNQESPTTYLKSRNELAFIGMPVGGLHSGTVYIGGDGRLWLWQIYNQTLDSIYEGVDPKSINWNDGTNVRSLKSRDGANYVEPTNANNRRVLEQGFAVRVNYQGKTFIKELNEESWDEIRFEASYPVATIHYESTDFPVSVILQAYSPFIPLEADLSSLPATVLRIRAANKTQEELSVDLIGWMENGVNKLSAQKVGSFRVNEAESSAGFTAVHFKCRHTDAALAQLADSGSMSLVLLQGQGQVNTDCNPWPIAAANFDIRKDQPSEKETPEKSVASIGTSIKITPGGHSQADYAITWFFNHPHPKLKDFVADAAQGYNYATHFADARAVGHYLAANFERLSKLTERWHTAWQDSSLPHWFLERTMLNIGTLATANTYRFADGRFWAWEGVGACPGTCTHVWQYAHTMARIFPSIERDQRERVDLGIALNPEGGIIFRAENESRPAIDGQAGTILRIYREHQMSADDSFLKRNWPHIKKAVSFMLAQDKNGDGMTDTPMENTLDAVWEGEIAWIVGLCIAAASAGHAMATEVGDKAFAKTCLTYVEKGSKNMESALFNGEYFIHRPDAVQGRKKLGSYNTCHIDQVYGQSWAFQVGLPRILDQSKTLTALRSLWKYNFTMDVGPYIQTHTGGRPYAVAGDGGMVMNTNPKNEPRPYGDNETWQLGYFHECMSGFEHQVAAHMMAEGMVDESLILTRKIHDRYHAARRNPYNEIECSDHYARAMASFGTYISACGYAYHGPKGYLAFAPKVNPKQFKAAFTTALGWGSYEQQANANEQAHQLTLLYGTLRLTAFGLEKLDDQPVGKLTAALNGKVIAAKTSNEGRQLTVHFKNDIHLKENDVLTIQVS